MLQCRGQDVGRTVKWRDQAVLPRRHKDTEAGRNLEIRNSGFVTCCGRRPNRVPTEGTEKAEGAATFNLFRDFRVSRGPIGSASVLSRVSWLPAPRPLCRRGKTSARLSRALRLAGVAARTNGVAFRRTACRPLFSGSVRTCVCRIIPPSWLRLHAASRSFRSTSSMTRAMAVGRPAGRRGGGCITRWPRSTLICVPGVLG